MDWPIVSAGVALFGVALHAVVYAYREGQKEQRLTAVEERVKNMPALEGLLAGLNATIRGIEKGLDDLKSDLKLDVAQINQTIRDHLMVRLPTAPRTPK